MLLPESPPQRLRIIPPALRSTKVAGHSYKKIESPMAYDSLTEAGKPHLKVEEDVTEAICQYYRIEAERDNDPGCRIDRFFYRRDEEGEGVYKKPVGLIEIKHRNKGKGAVSDYLEGGRWAKEGYLVSTDKIDHGITLSKKHKMPFGIVVVFEGNSPSDKPTVTHWKVTTRLNNTFTVPFKRVKERKTTQKSINGGVKSDLCDMIPTSQMEIMEEVSELYRRISA